MVRIDLMLKDRTLSEFMLDRDRITIGREPDNDIQIANLSVSRYHARISRTGEGDYCIEDLKSTNGTSVNGRRIAGPVTLNADDLISIGKFTLVFSCAERNAELPPDLKGPTVYIK